MVYTQFYNWHTITILTIFTIICVGTGIVLWIICSKYLCKHISAFTRSPLFSITAQEIAGKGNFISNICINIKLISQWRFLQIFHNYFTQIHAGSSSPKNPENKILPTSFTFNKFELCCNLTADIVNSNREFNLWIYNSQFSVGIVT